MKKILLISLTSIVTLLILFVGITVYREQRADYGWDPSLSKQTYTTTHPRVVIDQAHNNAHTAGIAGRFWPFARLARADGYDVQKGTEKFSSQYLNSVDILVIVNASGAPKPQVLGINFPMGTSGDRGAPAFTLDEIQALANWVGQGGSLLLVADHAPFGAASEELAAAFGVKMYKGFVEIPDELSDPLLFSKSNNRLGQHPIIDGDGAETAVSNVVTFTGQSLEGQADATILLRLPENAVEYIHATPGQEGGELVPIEAGNAQALALTVGQGRVVILGEAAMLTSQVYEGKPFGMNSEGNDNKQFALNVLHWLSLIL